MPRPPRTYPSVWNPQKLSPPKNLTRSTFVRPYFIGSERYYSHLTISLFLRPRPAREKLLDHLLLGSVINISSLSHQLTSIIDGTIEPAGTLYTSQWGYLSTTRWTSATIYIPSFPLRPVLTINLLCVYTCSSRQLGVPVSRLDLSSLSIRPFDKYIGHRKKNDGLFRMMSHD